MAPTVKAQLSLLYQVGKVDFPARAEEMAANLEVLAEVHSQWSGPTVRAGSPAALTKAMEINKSVYELLRRAVLSWQDAAYAMVAIADDLKATDENAADAANAIKFTLDTHPMPPTPTPPTLSEAQG